MLNLSSEKMPDKILSYTCYAKRVRNILNRDDIRKNYDKIYSELENSVTYDQHTIKKDKIPLSIFFKDGLVKGDYLDYSQAMKYICCSIGNQKIEHDIEQLQNIGNACSSLYNEIIKKILDKTKHELFVFSSFTFNSKNPRIRNYIFEDIVINSLYEKDFSYDFNKKSYFTEKESEELLKIYKDKDFNKFNDYVSSKKNSQKKIETFTSNLNGSPQNNSKDVQINNKSFLGAISVLATSSAMSTLLDAKLQKKIIGLNKSKTNINFSILSQSFEIDYRDIQNILMNIETPERYGSWRKFADPKKFEIVNEKIAKRITSKLNTSWSAKTFSSSLTKLPQVASVPAGLLLSFGVNVAIGAIFLLLDYHLQKIDDEEKEFSTNLSTTFENLQIEDIVEVIKAETSVSYQEKTFRFNGKQTIPYPIISGDSVTLYYCLNYLSSYFELNNYYQKIKDEITLTTQNLKKFYKRKEIKLLPDDPEDEEKAIYQGLKCSKTLVKALHDWILMNNIRETLEDANTTSSHYYKWQRVHYAYTQIYNSLGRNERNGYFEPDYKSRWGEDYLYIKNFPYLFAYQIKGLLLHFGVDSSYINIISIEEPKKYNKNLKPLLRTALKNITDFNKFFNLLNEKIESGRISATTDSINKFSISLDSLVINEQKILQRIIHFQKKSSRRTNPNIIEALIEWNKNNPNKKKQLKFSITFEVKYSKENDTFYLNESIAELIFDFSFWTRHITYDKPTPSIPGKVYLEKPEPDLGTDPKEVVNHSEKIDIQIDK